MTKILRLSILFLCMSCGSASHTRNSKNSRATSIPNKSSVDQNHETDTHTPGDESGYSCIIHRDEEVTILALNGYSKAWSGHTSEGDGLIAQIEVRLRVEAAAASLKVSSFRSYTIGERMLGGCEPSLRPDEPGYASRVHDPKDLQCLVGVAQNLNTRWLLSGFIEPVGDHFEVVLQLVSSREPAVTRSMVFSLVGLPSVQAFVHDAWQRLTIGSLNSPK